MHICISMPSCSLVFSSVLHAYHGVMSIALVQTTLYAFRAGTGTVINKTGIKQYQQATRDRSKVAGHTSRGCKHIVLLPSL